MNLNSKTGLSNEQLLHGWGAALAIGRKALNASLQDGFLEALGSLTYLEPFAGTFSVNEGASQLMQIEGLVIGAPQVSFENAVATDRLVTVRMPLLAGDYRYLLQLPGEPQRLHRTLGLREAMGYTLQARCRLAVHTDPESRQRHVLLDLGQATDFTCNLGDTSYERTQLGRRLQQWLAEQPEERRLLRLCTFDLRDYRPLSAKAVALITQPAPRAGEPGREGDGAVVLFMQLGVDWEPGTLPAADYPYLLPEDDKAEVALLVQKDLEALSLGTPAQVLRSLTLGNQSEIRLGDTAEQLSFGVLQPGPLTRELKPAIVNLGAGERQQFALAGGSGRIEWSARNLFRPQATGSMAAGLYQARPEQQFVKATQVVLVSGHFEGDAERLSASALVVEHEQPLDIAPRTANWSLGNPPIEFVVAGASAITWSLEGEQLGQLQVNGNRATFTPDQPAGQAAPIQRQRVRARYHDNGGEYSVEACVIIVNRASAVSIVPAFVARENVMAPVQFGLPENWRKQLADAGVSVPDHLQQDDFVWQLYGEGDITPQGLYTPAATPQSTASVVRLVIYDVVAGYAIIEHGRANHAHTAQLASWNRLSHFYVTALSAPQCFANGLQQIEVEVDIQTDQEGSEKPPISDDELLTLKFYSASGTELKVVDVGLEPPPAGEPGTWFMNRNRNELLRMQQGPAGIPGPRRALPGQRLWRYYLQSTTTETIVVHAIFKQAGLGGRYFNSEVVSTDKGRVRLQGQPLPTYDASRDYPWDEQEKRVVQEGAVVGGDRFNYMTLTVDYWKLTHVATPRERMPFVAIDIEALDNKSTMRWTSDEYEDLMCSYSGFMYGKRGPEGEIGMIYDGALERMAGKRGLKLQEVDQGRLPAENELLLSLNRVSDFRQRFEQPLDLDDLSDEEEAQRTYLRQVFRFRLLDAEGNRHDLQVSYSGSGRDGRNTFFLGKQ
ncbi:hypothetical protein KSS94_07625 [Pseudomonas fakonensis]|uniref:DUF4815 domain-containing protein n=1 Tax=Pseudomonas fakonensis TaxID=2842355 RepID=A0ABX8N9H0_9PSED|nr:hypothetical protein [Pseudomonas fakonensis]QXH52985.1 hypothetical protein KSS94_07625 [Pseudomonas fakonensis]